MRKTVILLDLGGAEVSRDVTDYMGEYEYKNKVLSRIHNTEGSCIRQSNGSFVYEYNLKDHLGNTRVTFSDTNGDWNIDPNTEVSQINHYYPFGLNMEGNWNGQGGANKYQYNGKEWNDDFGLGWNDYGARFYDPAMARWLTKDPLAEKFISYNPYNYVMNRPTVMIDPNGMEAIFNAKTGDLERATGKDAQNYVRGIQAKGGIKYSSTENKDGSYTTTLTVTIKIVNVSSDKSKDVNTLAANTRQKCEQTFKGSSSWTFNNGTSKAKQKQIHLVTNFNIIPVSSMNQVTSSDMAIGIVNQVVHRDKNGGQGLAEIYGHYAVVGVSEGVGTYRGAHRATG